MFTLAVFAYSIKTVKENITKCIICKFLNLETGTPTLYIHIIMTPCVGIRFTLNTEQALWLNDVRVAYKSH